MSQKGFSSLLTLFVVLVIVLLLGIFYFSNKPQDKQTLTIEPTPTPFVNTTETWSDYIQKSGGYKVQIPPKYLVVTKNSGNNMRPGDLSIVPYHFTQRRSEGEMLGTIYIEKQDNPISSNTSIEEYLTTGVFGTEKILPESITKTSIDGQEVYRILTSIAPYLRSDVTFIKLGNNIYRVLFGTGGGTGKAVEPPIYEWDNYSDYEKIIVSLQSL